MLDPARLTQAWLQLAANAVKYSEEDSRIWLGSAVRARDVEDAVSAGGGGPAPGPSGAAEGTELQVWVRDEGIGIAPADLDRVRRRFTRTAPAQRRAAGSGLGLSIVENIVGAHGGRLDIASELGRGSTFTLRIPLRPPEQARPARQKETSEHP